MVFEWLSNEDHGTWLIVLDSVDDSEIFYSRSNPILGGQGPVQLVSYLPRRSNCSIIITTRDTRVGERLTDRTKSIMVLPLEMQEAEVLLRSMLIEDENWTKEDALKLLKILEYLPLAITQAAAAAA